MLSIYESVYRRQYILYFICDIYVMVMCSNGIVYFCQAKTTVIYQLMQESYDIVYKCITYIYIYIIV